MLVKHNDRLGLRNVISSFEPAYARLQGAVDTLDPNAAADAAMLKELQTAAQSLPRYEEDARAAVKRIEGATKRNPEDFTTTHEGHKEERKYIEFPSRLCVLRVVNHKGSHHAPPVSPRRRGRCV